MRKSKRSAFTIVELVIVIAVIAILSAVLIPTFGSIIESANKAVDTQLVAQINTILAVEDVLGGGINDAVEIQKIIKDYGLKLQTKSKGQYIWYDIENKKAVLGGLDENGIVIEGLAAEPALAAEGETASKGQFIAATSPESFVKGYLFISTDSADNLADDIHTLRNPKGADPVKSITDAIANIKEENEVLGTNLESFMNTTAVMTEAGTFCINSANKNNVDRVIVSPDMATVTTTALGQLADYHNVVVVDLHSSVTNIDGQKATTDLAHIFFVYNSEGIAKIDKEFGGPDNNLITPDERSNYLHTIYWVDCIYDPSTGNATISENQNTVAEIKAEIYTFTYDFAYATKAGTDSLSYDFVGYSLNTDGSRPFALGNREYELTDAEKYKIDEDGYLTIYRVYHTASSDFKIGNDYYSSKTVTSMLAENGLASIPDGTTTITVVSTTATLGSATETSLKIPSGIELLLPYKSDFTKGSGTSVITKGTTFENNEMDFVNGTGATQLTIANGVNLVNEGSIHVDACLYYYSTPVQSFIKKNECGVLVVDGTITSTGNITALGVIRGSGSIAANSGSVDEVMTIYDWHGGTNAAMAVGVGDTYAWLASILGLDLDGKSTVPFHNWKIQNIQIPVTVQSGTTYSAINVVNINDTAIPVDFALAGSSDALFKMTAGSEMIRTVSADGDAKFIISKGSVEDTTKQLQLNNVVSYGGLGISATIDFTKISLPLSHFDVDVANGANLTISNNIYKVMPGSAITVDQGGVLNINTKVVICNSYDLVFEAKEERDDHTTGSNSRNVYSYTLIENGKKLQESKQYQTRSNLFSSWSNSGDPTITYITLPHTYPISTPAQLIVNGTVNFNSNAAFAGEITSTNSGAKIVVDSGVTVGGYVLPEGFATNKVWYYTDANGLYSKAYINNLEQTLTGTYTASYDATLDMCTWAQ